MAWLAVNKEAYKNSKKSDNCNDKVRFMIEAHFIATKHIKYARLS